MRILLAGGGTGGHVYPLLAIAEEIIKINSQAEIRFIGDGEVLKIETDKLGLKAVKVLGPKWRRYFSFLNLLDLLKLPIGFCQALFYVWRFMPDVIFTKGGYASLLPSIAGWIMFVPLVVHETDAIPGLTTKFLSRLAKKTFTSLETAVKYFKGKNIESVGNPVRQGILAGPDKNSALAAFGLNPGKPTVLVTGATQGAKIINDTLALAIVELAKKFQVIHQSGPKNFDEISRHMEQLLKEGKDNYGSEITANYRVYPIFDLTQMATAYAACDVIVSRAGSQIFESAIVGKPSIIVPLKNSSRNHQLANAHEFAKFGAIVIEEDNLKPHILINEIEKAYEHRAELSVKIKGFTKPDAAKVVAEYLLK